MRETVLLLELGAQRQANLGGTFAKHLELGAEEAAEGLARQRLAAHREEVGHGRDPKISDSARTLAFVSIPTGKRLIPHDSRK